MSNLIKVEPKALTACIIGNDSTAYTYALTFPSMIDKTDYTYKQSRESVRETVDLREWDGPIENQGIIGSCTGHAITNAFEIQMKRLYPEKYHELSTLFVYYHSRLFENNLTYDTGAYIKDGLKAVKRYGICKQDLWPYDTDKFDVQPYPDCYVDASKRVITLYEKLYSLTDILEILNSDKPVVTGMRIYDSFYSINEDNDVLAIPGYDETSIGGHTMVLVGYDITKGQFIAKNSFGIDWGNNGYCWIPFDYIRMEAFENWSFDIAVR